MFTTNAGGVVVFPTLSVIDPGAVSWWTGIEADWTSSVDHCSSWGDGTAGSSAQYGVGKTTTPPAFVVNTFTGEATVPL
ncbi:DUF1554 domain-containing protein [Leptospira barantonii]|uniref:DUF1554 domain-containing protein n=1 Tax=Leptospira barantonii TaxID=2023184 RepID=UPI003CD0DD38